MPFHINKIGVQMKVAAPITPTNYSSPGVTSQTRQSLSATTPPGSRLPQISYALHDPGAYYVSPAAFDGLNKFRNLAGGPVLLLPPVIPS